MCSDPRIAVARATPPPADALAAAVLGFVVAEHPAQLSIAEVSRWAADPLTPPYTAAIQDTLAELVSDGLAHRYGEFVFGSRAAMRARHLRP